MANDKQVKLLIKMGLDKSEADKVRKGIKSIDTALEEIAEQAGITSKEAVEAFKRIAKSGKQTFDVLSREVQQANKDMALLSRTGAIEFSKAGNVAEGAAGQFGMLARQAAAAGATLGVGMWAQDFAVNSFNAAAAAERLGSATDNLGKRFNVSGDQIVSSIQNASRGTISELEAMKAANNAMILGVVQSEEQFAELAEMAVVLGRAMGQDANKSISDLTEGLGRGSPEILNNLGIVIKAETAYQEWADANNRTVQSLNDAEKQQAVVNAALAKGRDLVDELGGVTDDRAGSVERLTASWSDFQVTFGNLVSDLGAIDSLTRFVDNLADGAKAWSSTAESLTTIDAILGDVSITFDASTEKVAAFTSALADVATPLDNFADGWQAFFDTFEEQDFDLINTPIEAIRNTYGTALEAPTQAAIAGIDLFTADEDVAASVDNLQQAEQAKQLAAGYAELAQAQEDSAAAVGELADEVEETTIALEDYEKAVKSVNDAERDLDTDIRRKQSDIETDRLRELADIEDDFQRDRLEAQIDTNRKYLDAAEDLAQDRVDIAREAAQKIKDTERELGQDITDANRDYARDIQSINRDLARERQDINKDYNRSIVSIARKEANEKLSAEEDYQRRLKEIRRDFEESAEDALRNQDVIAFLRAQRQQENAIQSAQEERDVRIEEARRTAQAEREAAAEERQQAIEDAKEQAEREKEEAAIRREQEIEDLRTQFERELEEQRLATDRKIEEAELDAERKREKIATAAEREREDLKKAEEQKKQDLEKSNQEKLADLNKYYNRRLVDMRQALEQELALVNEYESKKRQAQSTGIGGGRGGANYSGFSAANAAAYMAAFEGRQSGGYVSRGVYALAEDGRPEYVMNAANTRQMEQALGGQITSAGIAAITRSMNYAPQYTVNGSQMSPEQIVGMIRQQVDERLLRHERGF